MDDDNEEYEETTQVYPEEPPQAGPNAWDIVRILTLPALSLSQGIAKMIDQFYGLLIYQSEVHDARKANEEMEKAFK